MFPFKLFELFDHSIFLFRFIFQTITTVNISYCMIYPYIMLRFCLNVFILLLCILYGFRNKICQSINQSINYSTTDELRLGMHYFDAVYYNVENSFKTVLLLSRAAVQDHIFMTKLRIAMNHVTDTETDNLILVFREDTPDQELPHLVRLHLSGQGAYLSWEEDEEGQEYFWNKL